jgi:hypothetical protein
MNIYFDRRRQISISTGINIQRGVLPGLCGSPGIGGFAVAFAVSPPD